MGGGEGGKVGVKLLKRVAVRTQQLMKCIVEGCFTGRGRERIRGGGAEKASPLETAVGAKIVAGKGTNSIPEAYSRRGSSWTTRWGIKGKDVEMPFNGGEKIEGGEQMRSYWLGRGGSVRVESRKEREEKQSGFARRFIL